MPRPIQTSKRYPVKHKITFPQDAVAKQTNPSHDPCEMWMRGELTDRQEEDIDIAIIEWKETLDEEGKLVPVAVTNPVKVPTAILDAVFSDPMTGWNLEDAEGDAIPCNREQFGKLDKRDRNGFTDEQGTRHPGLKELIATYFGEQMSEASLVEPSAKDLESEDPTTPPSPGERSNADSDSTTSPTAGVLSFPQMTTSAVPSSTTPDSENSPSLAD